MSHADREARPDGSLVFGSQVRREPSCPGTPQCCPRPRLSPWPCTRNSIGVGNSRKSIDVSGSTPACSSFPDIHDADLFPLNRQEILCADLPPSAKLGHDVRKNRVCRSCIVQRAMLVYDFNAERKGYRADAVVRQIPAQVRRRSTRISTLQCRRILSGSSPRNLDAVAV